MFAIAFDLIVAAVEQHHPRGVSPAYSDIASCLAGYGFKRVQGSLYVSEKEDMAVLFQAIHALRAMPWLPPSVRDIRAFRVEQWSDFTAIVRGGGAPPSVDGTP